MKDDTNQVIEQQASGTPSRGFDLFCLAAIAICAYAYSVKDDVKVIQPIVNVQVDIIHDTLNYRLLTITSADSIGSPDSTKMSIINDTSVYHLYADSYNGEHNAVATNIAGGSIIDNSRFNVIVKEDTSKDVVYEPTHKEWYAFDNTWRYNYEPIEYTEEELALFTNILYRESRSSNNLSKEIDQYLVMICAVRRFHYDRGNKAPIRCPRDIVTKCHSFTIPDNPHKTLDNRHWYKCQKIVKNVFHCNIPSYIPYIPHGTFAYWNSRIDTNMRQKQSLQTRHTIVASTVKDHHYFARVEHLLPSEVDYLSAVQKTRPNKISKNISNGVIFNHTNGNNNNVLSQHR